ncbi:hypothetical protein J6590_040138 [Homalodisca vitripennis]|nr:hypothetical protein J6590_040138 [Homalodisca vitripennis]
MSNALMKISKRSNIGILFSLVKEMSQKSITSFFTKSPANNSMKRSLSEIENIDGSNIMSEDKKVKLDLVNECKESLNNPDQSLDNAEIGCNLTAEDDNESQIVKAASSKTIQEASKLNKIEINRLTAQAKLLSKTLAALHPNIGLTWFQALRNEFDKPYFKKLQLFLSHKFHIMDFSVRGQHVEAT